MTSPLICSCSGHQTAQSKMTLKKSCLFQSSVIPSLQTLLATENTCRQMATNFAAKSIWIFSHECECLIQFWKFKWCIIKLSSVFSNFIFCFSLCIKMYFIYQAFLTIFYCNILVFGFFFNLYRFVFVLLNILNSQEKKAFSLPSAVFQAQGQS
jgi:hypothetical protein